MATLIRLLRFLQPHWAAVGVTALAAIGLMACSITLPYLTGEVVQRVLREGDESVLLPLTIAFLVLAGVRMALAAVRRWVAGHVSLAVEFDLRERLFGHLQQLSFAYFDRNSVGQLMSRATSDLQTVRFFLGYGLIFIFMSAFTLVAVTVVMMLVSPFLALLALLTGPVLLAVTWRYSRLNNPVLIDVQQRLAEVSQHAEESATGIRVIKSFGRERERTGEFAGRARAAFERSMDSNRIQAFYQPLMGFIPAVGVAIVMAVGGLMVIDGQINLGEFTAFYFWLLLLMYPFRSLGFLISQAQRAIAGGKRIFEVLDAPVTVREAERPRPLPAGDGGVRFEGVRFGYDPARPVLSDIDLEVPAGHTVAVIGATGSGKSTLAQLIPRYYDADAGRVLVEGVDVRELELAGLRRAVGVVSQEPFLFSASVRENIAFGAPERSEDEIVAAARLAQADGFIGRLPEGYDTRVGERGYTLSGGQRQRVAIARAILTDPRILILDEATASVDATTEREIQAALAAVTHGRTTLVIAHRLSTISLADEIVVLEAGRIVAQGTADDLYETSAVYRDIRDGGLARPTLIAGEAT